MYANDPLVIAWLSKPEPKVPLVTSVSHIDSNDTTRHTITFGGDVIGLNGASIAKDVLEDAILKAEEKLGHKILFITGPGERKGKVY